MECLCRAQRKCGRGTHAKAFRRTEDEVKLTLKRNKSHWEKKAGRTFCAEKRSMTKVC